MANLKAIAIRLKSVKNIQKITQSMKMVSAAKYARAERDLKAARPYGAGAQAFYEQAKVGEDAEGAPAPAGKELYVAITSDRGLCGGVHSSICKTIRNELLEKPSLDNVGIICVGDKSRAQISRLFKPNILAVGSEIGRLPPQFGDASKIANAILNSGEFDTGKMYYNKFRSVVSYKTQEIPIYPVSTVQKAANLPVYDSLDADVLQSYMEYSLASLIYYCLKEGATSEQSSRMTAMDNSSKNAGEMIDKLTLTYNRTRQAVITGELIEIISGAAAL
jgi:F-type H+-transporting ATPase subunit gamma